MAIETRSGSKTSPREVIERAKAEGVEVVDVRFIDLPGTWQHFSLPLGELEEDSFTGGLGFDGSSIRGFQSIDESDMLLIPDPDSATIDPVLSHKTLFLICDVVDPITRQPYSRDARFIAKKAEEHLRRTGIADVSYWGPEAEFYLFNSLRFDQNAHSGYYYIDSEEGIWNSGKNSEPNLAFRPRHKEGYFPVPPTDKLQDLRSEIMLKLIEAGVRVEVQHHEVGTAGQAEIDMRFDSLTKMGDKMMVYKYVIKNIAAQHGYVATFMPKPLFQDNGSGMHLRQSPWTKTSTSSRARRRPRSGPYRDRWPNHSTRWRRTTLSCSKAGSSPKTSSTPGSTTSARRKSTRSRCVRTHGSSCSTPTFS